MHMYLTQGKALDALTDEEASYETLIQYFGHPVFNIVSRLINDPSDAAQVTQRVFRKAFRNVGTLRGKRTQKTWIYRIAVSEARNHRRWFTGRRQPFEAMVDPETNVLIEEALKMMSPKLRAVLVLREIEGLSYEEISEILEVSLDRVKSRITRGRHALRKNMAGRLNLSSALIENNGGLEKTRTSDLFRVKEAL
jgi:RNA polymerase sigma-70 factor (ECF subfamily)